MEQEKIEKLSTGQDWVSAAILSKRTAIVKGISQNYEIGYDDLVLFDPVTNKITQVIKKNSNTVYVKFQQDWRNFGKMDAYFSKNNIRIESLIPGIAGLAIPVDISDEDFQIIFHNCPVSCELLTEEDNKVQDIDEDDEDDDYV